MIWTSPTRAYVASERDREVIALDVSAGAIAVADRIKTDGQPVAFAARGTRLYMALDNDDRVAVHDTARDRNIDDFRAAQDAGAPPAIARLGGAGTNGLALSGDGRTLYASNGGANDVSVIRLSDKVGGARVVGLIPTGWYPTALAVQPGFGASSMSSTPRVRRRAQPSATAARSTPASIRTMAMSCRRTTSHRQPIRLAARAPAGVTATLCAARAGRAEAGLTAAGGGQQPLRLRPLPLPASEETMAFLRAPHPPRDLHSVKENPPTPIRCWATSEVGDGDPKLEAVFGHAMTPTSTTSPASSSASTPSSTAARATALAGTGPRRRA